MVHSALFVFGDGSLITNVSRPAANRNMSKASSCLTRCLVPRVVGLLLFIVSCLAPVSLTAQSDFRNGVPTYTVFESNLTGANAPITSLSTDSLGRLVVASGSKLLAFDGSLWYHHLQSAPDGEEPTSIYSFHTGPDGILYSLAATGIYKVEFLGNQRFALRGFGYDERILGDDSIAVLYRAFNVGSDIVFYGFDRSMRYDTQTGEFAHDEIDRQSTSNLYPFRDDILEYGTSGSIYFYKDNELNGRLDTGRGGMLGQETRALVEWRDTIYLGFDTGLGRLVDGVIEIWDTELDLLPTQNIAGLLPISENEIAVSVKSQGIFVLNPQGQILQSLDRNIDHRFGRIENLIHGGNGVVWVSFDQSVARIDFLNAISNFSASLPYATHYPRVFFHEDVLHVLTDGKLLRARHFEGGGLHGFEDLILNLSEDIAAALSTEEGILYSNYQGVFLLRPTGLSEFVSDQPRVGLLGRVGVEGNRIFSASNETIQIIENVNGNWQATEIEIDSPGRSYYSLQRSDGKVWLEHGVGRASLLGLVDEGLDMRTLGTEDGLSDTWINIWTYSGTEYLTSGASSPVVVWNDTEKQLEPKSADFIDFLVKVPQLTRPAEDRLGNLWLPSSSNAHAILRQDADGSFQLDDLSLEDLRGEELVKAIPGEEGAMWLVGRNRLFRYDPRMIKERALLESSLIYQIEYEREHRIIYDSRTDGEPEQIIVPYRDNSLRVFVTNPNIGYNKALFHQYSLSGVEGSWSNLTATNAVYLSNLKEGAYQVFIRPTYDGLSFGPVSSVAFTVLPPVYRHMGAYVLYLFIFVMGIWILVRFMQKRANARNEELQVLVHERTKGLDEANKNLTVLYEQVKSADQAKGNFLATVSHEMRTPLNAIIAPSQLLLSEDPNETQKKFITMINNAGTHLLSLVDDVLQFASSGQQRQELDILRFDLRAAVEEIVESFQPKAIGKGISLSCEVESGMSRYWEGDEKVFSQVVGNLLNNAIKFTLEGCVNLRCSYLEVDPTKGMHEMVCVEVLDTGVGIPESAREIVFDPFQQLENAFTRNFDGVGLGLSICRQLVARMKGKIDFESEEGKGTRFWFEVPMVPLLDEAGENHRALAADRRFEAKLVLVVDDHEANRESAAFFLKKMGCVVEFANDGKDAVQMTQLKHYDLILMDVRMPKMNGIDASSEIRKNSNRNNDTPIVVLSAFLSRDLEGECLESGIDIWLNKPFNIEQLQEAIIDAFESRRDVG